MKISSVSIVLLGLLIASMVTVFPAISLPANAMWIQPSTLSFSTSSTAVGFKFNVTVWFNVTTGTNSWQFYLIYNKAHLNAIRMDYTGYYQSQWSGSSSVNTVTPSFGNHNATHGYAFHGEVLKDSLEKTGVGSLSWVEFEIIQAPSEGQSLTSELRLDVMGVFNSFAMNKDFDSIALTYGKTTYTYSSPWTPPPPAKIYIDPPKIVDPLLAPCSNFTVNVKITNATNVYSFAFKLGFDKNIIKVVEAQLGSFFPPSTVPIIVIDNTAGYVSISATLSSPLGVSGNGTLAKIKFHVETEGASNLHLYDVSLKDEVARTLPYTTSDGYFNNVLLAKLYIDPPEIIDPALLPPKTFDVNVTLDDVENLYGYEFNVSFNNAVLTCLYIMVHDVLGETSYTLETQASNAKGFAWAKVDYYPPAIPITTFTPVALATLHFRVKSAGASPLDLHDTSLTNSTGGSIPHEVSDGFVMTVIHDVAVTAVTPSPSWAYAGWPVNVTVVARNLGNVSETFNVTAYYDSTIIGTITVENLAPDNETTLTFTWNTTGLTEGNYTLSANATIMPYELNTANNVYVDGDVQILTTIRDVAVTNVAPELNWAYKGWLVKIVVTVENLGEQNETFDVTAYYDSNVIGTINVANLVPVTALNLTFTWNTATVTPCNNYTISAQATIIPYEYNTTNNQLVDGKVKIRIVADVNGDGKVDITDVAMASAAFGSYPGHPRWNPAADVNRDGKVDIADVAIVSSKFGTTC